MLHVFNRKLPCVTATHGSRQMPYFGFNEVQNYDFTAKLDADNKLEDLGSNLTTRSKRKDFAIVINEVQKSALSSLCSSLGSLETTAFPFRTAVASHLQ